MAESPKNILVAPLNWGLGHATRCIPIIKILLENGFRPILASDGMALEILKKEFPDLLALELPSYEIEYAKNGSNFKWKMLKNMPVMADAIMSEKKIVKKWVKEYNLSGIISDNRLGVYNKKVPSVFITHQLNVLTGNTSWLTSVMHQFAIKKFDECWVPDFEKTPNLTGKLGHLKKPGFKVNYIGPLSRLQKTDARKKYDLMVLLSGPEPQRSILEEKLIEETKRFNGQVVFVSGNVQKEQTVNQVDHVTFYNFMSSVQLERTFNESEMVLCRSGYTTVMDLVYLGKKAFFIPTPGQYEQEYLAKKLKKESLFPYAKQDKFKIENLLETKLYSGMKIDGNETNWKRLLCLFEGE